MVSEPLKPTNTTALVVIPPEEIWSVIQAIRQRYDKTFKRWMPHLTLICPFVPREMFDQAAKVIRRVCRSLEPFDVQLTDVTYFSHGKGFYTLWTKPEFNEPLYRLHDELSHRLLLDVGLDAWEERFRPHLCVGQVRGTAKTVAAVQEISKVWNPVRFTVSNVAMIWRNNRPDDVFRVDRDVGLGRSARPAGAP